MPNLMKSAFNQWYRRFALFHQDLKKISQVSGFLADAKAKGKKTLAPIQVEMQFLEKHKILYLDLHRDLSKMEYAP